MIELICLSIWDSRLKDSSVTHRVLPMRLPQSSFHCWKTRPQSWNNHATHTLRTLTQSPLESKSLHLMLKTLFYLLRAVSLRTIPSPDPIDTVTHIHTRKLPSRTWAWFVGTLRLKVVSEGYNRSCTVIVLKRQYRLDMFMSRMPEHSVPVPNLNTKRQSRPNSESYYQEAITTSIIYQKAFMPHPSSEGFLITFQLQILLHNSHQEYFF